MDMYLWDSYEEGDLNDKIKYWVDLWQDLIDSFNKNSYGLNLSNPHLLLNEIIDELENNEFRNKENKKYFYQQLNYFFDYDPVIKNDFLTGFALIRRIFNSKRNYYLLQICKSVQHEFRTGKYFTKQCEYLKKILLNPKWLQDDYQAINILCQNIIVEFLLKGYSLESIVEFPKNIFDKYKFYDGKIYSSYHYKTLRENFDHDGNFDQEGFNNAVRSEIESLTISDRLERFQIYYFLPNRVKYIIFQIYGLKGDGEISIGDVNFYSPYQKTYLKKPFSPKSKDEFFKSNRYHHFMNAAVRVENIDSRESIQEAIEKVEKAFDLLRCFINTSTNFEIAPEKCLVVDSEGEEVGFGFLGNEARENYKLDMSFDSKTIEKNDDLQESLSTSGSFLYKPHDMQTNIEQKITYAIHWYRKGLEAKKLEDQILNFWIVIESLLTFKNKSGNILLPEGSKEDKYILAKEILTAIQISNFIYSTGWELRRYLFRLLNSRQGSRPLLTLPEDLLEKSGLNPKPPTKVYLKPFLDTLPELIKVVNRKIIHDKMLFVEKFYNNKKFAKEILEEKSAEIKSDVLLIYRYRNQIVHNATFDNKVLPYFVQKAKNLASSLILKILKKYNSDKTEDIERILVLEYVKMNQLVGLLEKKNILECIEL